jgi:hypothetical protein
MKALKSWLFLDGQDLVQIEYYGITPEGGAKITLNSAEMVLPLIGVGDSYQSELPLGTKPYVLAMSKQGDSVTLLVDGAAQPAVPEAVPAAPVASVWEKRARAGMGSFLTLIILSLVNNVLIIVEATLSFPFSIASAAYALSLGKAFAEHDGNRLLFIAGLVLSFLIIGLFTALYFLARRYTWPVWTAFALIVLDTLLLLGLTFLTELSFIDLAFHLWMVGSLFRLGQSKLKIARETAAISG